MSETMLAAVLHGIKDLRVDECAVPELEPGKVLVRMRRAGICGSDIHYFHEGRFGRFAVTAPFILGHEASGEVLAVAADVRAPAVGARVAINPARSCGFCDYCRSGRINLCRYCVMRGSASTKPPTHGLFSQCAVVGAEQCHLLPDSVDDALGAMIEPFAVGVHAVHRAGSVAGRKVLVTGGGPIGLLTLIAAKAYGANPVVLSDPVPSRRAMAMALGADAVLDPGTAVQDQVAALTGDGFDIVFEASGAVPALRQAFEVLRRGGQMVQIGVFSAEEISLPVNQLLIGEFQFLGSFRYGAVFDEAIRLVASNRVDLRPLISRVFPLREANAALTLACAKNDAVKVQIDLA